LDKLKTIEALVWENQEWKAFILSIAEAWLECMSIDYRHFGTKYHLSFESDGFFFIFHIPGGSRSHNKSHRVRLKLTRSEMETAIEGTFFKREKTRKRNIPVLTLVDKVTRTYHYDREAPIIEFLETADWALESVNTDELVSLRQALEAVNLELSCRKQKLQELLDEQEGKEVFLEALVKVL